MKSRIERIKKAVEKRGLNYVLIEINNFQFGSVKEFIDEIKVWESKETFEAWEKSINEKLIPTLEKAKEKIEENKEIGKNEYPLKAIAYMNRANNRRCTTSEISRDIKLVFAYLKKWLEGEKTEKKQVQEKKEYTKKEGEKISIKSFCCSALGLIRDFMIQEMNIEDYKNDTSEIGLARKKVLGALIAYSKTKDQEKIENFKKSVVGRFSQVFEAWENLKNQLLELEQEFKG